MGATRTSALISIVLAAALAGAPAGAADVGDAAAVVRVSVASDGAQASRPSGVVELSGSGRWAAFTSAATELVPGHIGRQPDVFRHDRRRGRTVLVSVGRRGATADGASRTGGLSDDGDVVSFDSLATNLVRRDPNGLHDVFVRRVRAGRTELISVGLGGAAADGPSVRPDVSADGRFVVWDSFATNLVPADTNGGLDVFLRDRVAGTTERLSITSAEEQANGESTTAAISADGRFVVFESGATNLDDVVDDNDRSDVFLRDRQLGTTEIISVGLDGTAADGVSVLGDVSDDGRYVAFVSTAADHVPGDTNGAADVFVRDRVLGTTVRASVATDGGEAATGCGCIGVAMSGDGRRVTFDSESPDLVAGDTNGAFDVFVRDLAAGTTTRRSTSAGGAQADLDSLAPAISRTGRVVGFQSGATNLVPADSNGVADAFLHVR